MSTAELAGQTAEPAVSAVAVQDLQVVIETTGTPVISEVSFGIARGEILGVVGESGSGKTTVGLALLGHARRGLRIGTQLREVIEAHGNQPDSAVSERVAEMMREVALPGDRAFLKRYPHELSGGQH